MNIWACIFSYLLVCTITIHAMEVTVAPDDEMYDISLLTSVETKEENNIPSNNDSLYNLMNEITARQVARPKSCCDTFCSTCYAYNKFAYFGTLSGLVSLQCFVAAGINCACGSTCVNYPAYCIVYNVFGTVFAALTGACTYKYVKNKKQYYNT